MIAEGGSTYSNIPKNKTEVIYKNIAKNSTSKTSKKGLETLGYELEPITIKGAYVRETVENLVTLDTQSKRRLADEYIVHMKENPFEDTDNYKELMELLNKHYKEYPFTIYTGYTYIEKYEIENELRTYYNMEE